MSLDSGTGYRAMRSDDAAGNPVSDSARLIAALEVELAGEKIDLPSFPDVAMRVRKALTNDQVAVEQVVRVVSAEPALAARLMQLANSAALNPSGKRLTELRTAISRIGFNMARSATIAFAMSQLRRAEAYKGLEVPLTELWQNSAHIAAVSHAIAKRFTSLNPDTALLAGLLHGVGKLYLLARVARYPGLLGDLGTYQRLVAEWHRRVARAILTNWEMADAIVSAVCDYENCERDHEGLADYTDVLGVAAAIATLGPDPAPEQMLFLGMPAARRMKLDAASCGAALAESHNDISSLRQALGT
jgi:HD-like signal output (HDOD) protein